jgi:hypothetical protein
VGFLLSCGTASAPPPPSDTKLGGDVVARVGDELITESAVLRIAKAQHLGPRQALDRAIFDALAAQEARSSGLAESRRPELTGALARRLSADLLVESEAKGPVTLEEIGKQVERDWFTVARPRSVVTVHAVVRVAPDADPSKWEEATALASRIREAVLPAAEAARAKPGPALEWSNRNQLPDDPAAAVFLERAESVAAQGFEVVRQRLDPVAADGLTVTPKYRDTFDPDFVKRVTTMEKRGDLSEPFRSSAGVHVVLALDWLPASELRPEELLERYRPEALDLRARARAAELRAALEPTTKVEIDRAVDALLEQVRLSP